MGSQRTGHDGTTTGKAATLLLETRSLTLLNRPGVVIAFLSVPCWPKDLLKQAYWTLPLEPGALHPFDATNPAAHRRWGFTLFPSATPSCSWCSCFWLEFLHILNYWDVTRKLFFSNLVHSFVYAGSLLLHSSFL